MRSASSGAPARSSARAPSKAVTASSSAPPPAAIRSATATCCRVASASPATPAANARKRSTLPWQYAPMPSTAPAPDSGASSSRFIAHHSASPARAALAMVCTSQHTHSLSRGSASMAWRPTCPRAAEVRSASPMWPSM